jgi:molybdate transport system substrate-binding protein
MNRLLLIIFWLFLAFKSSMAEVIRVFAAADLQYALKEIAQEYMKANPQDRVELIFGSSGKGAIQIRKGAPYHLFFSANMKYVEELHREGYIITQPKAYAIGRIVVWVRKDSGLDPSNFPDVLFRANKIAIANWEHAPYGQAAKEALESYGVFEKVKNRLVIGENISQTASYVYSGAVDVGIIALSLSLSPTMKEKGRYWLIPQERHRPIVQGYGITKFGENSPSARRFYNFIETKTARDILLKYGFFMPEGRQ